MSRLRQLPQVYLRGAMANETMKSLSDQDKRQLNEIMEDMLKRPGITKHRNDFIRKLSKTIGCDYNDDKLAGDNEFKIAMWRGLVYLIYHHEYTFKCESCNNSSYLTLRSKPKQFDRKYPICPACNTVKCEEQFVNFDSVQGKLLVGEQVSYSSPIISIKGKKKIKDHQAVMSDQEQLEKFMTDFIWNYFRQILRENEIKHHDKKLRVISGPADQIAVEEILSTLSRIKFPYFYQQALNPFNSHYYIQTNIDCADAATIEQLTSIVNKYDRMDVKITINDTNIVVKESGFDVEIIDAVVTKPQVVAIAATPQCIVDNDDGFQSTVDANHHQIVLKPKVVDGIVVGSAPPMQEDGIAEFEANDLLTAIKDNLPEGAQQVLEIYTQNGETWHQFTMSSADDPKKQKPTIPQIAKFLNTNAKQIKAWHQMIKLNCLAHGMI